MNLHFLGVAIADDSLLDQPRGIFADLDSRAGGTHQHDAARLPQFKCRLRVLVDEHLFGGGRVGALFRDQPLELIGKRREALGKRRPGIGLDLAVGDMREAIAISFDQAPAGRAEAGIEAENPQASFSSSSSGTS